ncbi:hypothetical protein [Luteolibacter sp. Populi]|uniref:hypothetical protein n=1 Tax=Luteolibacter sp. Populi TaxID=3230487 RepID=UPI003465BBA8
MAVLPYASLNSVRAAIRSRQVLRFRYRKSLVTAEPHLLGNFRKTHALVLRGWQVGPDEGWEYFRYAEMRDVEVLLDCFPRIREGFNSCDPKIVEIDTCIRIAR